MKEYRGYFRSCDTSIDPEGQLFKVSIYANFNYNGNDVEEITLTDSPFIVEYEGDESNYQKPYKCSVATVNFIYPEFNSDFIDTNNNNMLVVLGKWRNNNYFEDGYWHYSYDTVTGTKSNRISGTIDELPTNANFWEIKWIGFGTPNTYNQGFEGVFDEVSINAQDALSTLSYIDYSPINTDKSVVSFSDIIKHYIKQLKTYKYVYITDSLIVKSEQPQDILHQLYIHENNFFDENEKPMKVLEVIEHICNYLRLTLIPYGDSLYFVNYDAIKNGHNNYYVWKCETENFSQQYLINPNYIYYTNEVELEFTHTIEKDDFVESGTSLTVLGSYNKVTVKDDVYPIDTIIPVIKNENNIVIQNYNDSIASVSGTGGGYTITYSKNDITRLRTYITAENEKHILFINFRNYNDPHVKTYWYPIDSFTSTPIDTLTPNNTPVDFDTNRRWRIYPTHNYTPAPLDSSHGEYIGCCLIEYKDYILNQDESSVSNIHSIDLDRAFAFFQRIPEEYASQHRDEKWNISYDKNVCPTYLHPSQPMLEFSANDVLFDKSTILKIEGTFKFYGLNLSVPFDRKDEVTKCSRETCFVWASLQVGDKYWAENLEWVDSSASEEFKVFRLPLEFEDGKNAYYTDFNIVSNILGYKIDKNYDEYYSVPSPIEDDRTYVKDVKLTIYRTLSPRLERYCALALLRNFDMSTKTTYMVGYNSIISKDNGSNTEFSNKLDSTSVEDYPDVENKVTTWTNKYPNNSCVLLQTSFYENGYHNVNEHTFSKLVGIYYTGLDNWLMPEDFTISSIQKQYKQPTISVSLNLKESLGVTPWGLLDYHYFEGSRFIVDSCSYDYRWNKNTINIFQKQ